MEGSGYGSRVVDLQEDRNLSVCKEINIVTASKIVFAITETTVMPPPPPPHTHTSVFASVIIIRKHNGNMPSSVSVSCIVVHF